MRRGFTLVEMLVSILLTAILFAYLYGTLDNLKNSHDRYSDSTAKIESAQMIFSLLYRDLTQLKKRASIVHEAGFDRISFTTKNSLYGIARPWVFYYISAKENALIRVEATKPVDFFGGYYVNDANGTYFFADKLATGCESFRVAERGERIDLMVRCKKMAPIAATLYKGGR
ncbi:MAG: prepilin-type N-terminal cleavage/methylation domain-containing protein [Hydrogenimonas sp.]|nr:prepilin-type N-terminal cleavage/methylation domain-containing protein [Hydrogenimonas sp.]